MKHTDEQCIEVAVTYFRDALIAIGHTASKLTKSTRQDNQYTGTETNQKTNGEAGDDT